MPQKQMSASAASGPRGQAKRRIARRDVLVLSAQERSRRERPGGDGRGDDREMRAHADAAGRGSRREPGAGEQAEAPRGVEAREDRPPVPALERDAVRVPADVGDAEAGADQRGREHEECERGCERREGEPGRRHDDPCRP